MSAYLRLLPAVLLAACLSTVHAEPHRTAAAAINPTRSAAPFRAAAVINAAPQGSVAEPVRKTLLVGVPFADAGVPDGFRLSNLGGHREIYIPVPQGVPLNLAELVLVYDDVSAYEARRSLEILANDRSIAALALDGKSAGRAAHISLANAAVRDGFLKLSFVYSGAATQDRCIDVRSVGDSISIRSESAVQFEIGTSGIPSITASVALMPKDVAILLSDIAPPPSDIAAALTLARGLAATGRHVTFYHGINSLPDLVDRDDKRRWTRGLIVVGAFDRIADRLDAPLATLASAAAATINSTLAATRIVGVPVLLVTDPASSSVPRLLENPSLAALRDTPTASIGMAAAPERSSDRISFDELGVTAPQAEVFGRADLAVAIASRSLPAGTRPSRLMLDVMVAPDAAGEKAVVSAFVNERLLASTVAVVGAPTRLDFALPAGLVGSVANIRTVVQRRSAQGDCRFEPQGYPAEILGSSQIVLSGAGSTAQDFSDLATQWSRGVELLLPASTASHPLSVLASLSGVLNALSSETTPIDVKYVAGETAPSPTSAFIAVSTMPPVGAEQHVHFDRGRVAIVDRAGHPLLDIGGITTGGIAQIVSSNAHPGLWLRPLGNDGALAVSPAINLDRGNVAYLDKTGVALALSTERDTLLRVYYPDQGSWTADLDRFWPWIVGSAWVLATLALMLLMQRMYRRHLSSKSRG